MEDRKGCGVSVLIILGVGLILFLIFNTLFWWILGLIGILVVAVIVLLIVMNAKDKKRKQEKVADGITLGDVESYIADCERQLQDIRRHMYKLKDSDMREELDQISTLCRKLFRQLKDDPKDMRVVRRFMDTMLPSLDRIVNQSVVLFGNPSPDEESKRALAEAKEGMTLLRKAIEAQSSKLNENNILDLDVEVNVLKKTLAARGLLEDDKDDSPS